MPSKGTRILTYCKRNKISLREFARGTGIDVGNLSRMSKGNLRITYESAVKMAAFTSKPVSYWYES